MQSNINPIEIEKFSQIASRWWDKNGECKPLHEINPLRLEFIKQQINLCETKILDVGCGGGILTESLAQAGACVTGIDASAELINIAKLHKYETKLTIDYQLTTIEEFSEKNPNAFDVITCMELLEHVPDPISIINACSKLIKPQGYLFFSTINRNLKSYFQAIIGAEYILRLLKIGTHDYRQFIRPSELDKWARATDLSLEKMIGFTYNPLTAEYKLTSNTDINYLVCYRNNL